MKHPSQQEILYLLSGQSDTLRAEALFGHLDTCPACSERHTALRAITADFDGAWDAFVEEFQIRAGEAGFVEAPEVSGFELLVTGVIDGARRLASLGLGQLSGGRGLAGLEGSFAPAYSGVGDPDSSGVRALSEKASEHCRRGDFTGALRDLQEISKRDPEAGASGILEIRSGTEVVGRVVADANRKSVSVLVDLERVTQSGMQAVLEIQESKGVYKQSKPLEPVPGANYHLAEFEHVPDGSFSVRVEPRSS